MAEQLELPLEVDNLAANLPGSIECLSEESRKYFTSFKTMPHEQISLSLTADGRFKAWLRAAYSTEDVWCRAIPESKPVFTHVGKYWLFPATDTFLIHLKMAWRNSQILFEDEATKQTAELLWLQVLIGDQSAKMQVAYKQSGVVPNKTFYVSHGTKLGKHQITAATCGTSSVQGYGLFMKPGTGKTLTAIAIANDMAINVCKAEKRPLRVLVVCPNCVQTNWKDEIERFSFFPSRATVVRGDKLARIKKIGESINVNLGNELIHYAILGYGSLDNMTSDKPGKTGILTMIDWDIVILDEGHYIKDSKTARHKAALRLRDKSTKRFVLTGTPTANNPAELYSLFEFIGKGLSGFSSEKAFRKFFNVQQKDENGRIADKEFNLKRLPLLQERLARLSFEVKLEDVVEDLPDLVYDVYDVEMTAVQRGIYQRVTSEVEIEVKNILNNTTMSGQMVVQNILVAMLRLAQVAAGHVVYPEIKDENGNILQQRKVGIIEPNPKVEAVLELMRDKEPHRKTHIWCNFVEDIEAVRRGLAAAGIDGVTYFGGTSTADRELAVKRFNEDPTCRYFLGTAAAGGIGLNLLGYPPHTENPTTWCDHAISFSKGWKAPERVQSIARGFRMGVKHNFRVTDLICSNSIDEYIHSTVMGKLELSEKVSDMSSLFKSIFGRVIK